MTQRLSARFINRTFPFQMELEFLMTQMFYTFLLLICIFESYLKSNDIVFIKVEYIFLHLKGKLNRERFNSSFCHCYFFVVLVSHISIYVIPSQSTVVATHSAIKMFRYNEEYMYIYIVLSTN